MQKKYLLARQNLIKRVLKMKLTQWLVKFAKMNKRVLRLKGGDISFLVEAARKLIF